MASDAPPAGGPPAGKGKGKKPWYKQPYALAIGGGAALALLVLFMRSKNAAAGGTGTTVAPDSGVSPTLGGPTVAPAGFSDSTAGFNQLQAGLEQLQGQLGQYATLADVQAALSPGSTAQQTTQQRINAGYLGSTKDPQYYTVQKGDTWLSIAGKEAKNYKFAGKPYIEWLGRVNPQYVGVNPPVGTKVRIT